MFSFANVGISNLLDPGLSVDDASSYERKEIDEILPLDPESSVIGGLETDFPTIDQISPSEIGNALECSMLRTP